MTKDAESETKGRWIWSPWPRWVKVTLALIIIVGLNTLWITSGEADVTHICPRCDYVDTHLSLGLLLFANVLVFGGLYAVGRSCWK